MLFDLCILVTVVDGSGAIRPGRLIFVRRQAGAGFADVAQHARDRIRERDPSGGVAG